MIPSVWMSVDHLCILWCKELVMSVVRLLFDLVHVQSGQILRDFNLRNNIIDYHLLNVNIMGFL